MTPGDPWGERNNLVAEGFPVGSLPAFGHFPPAKPDCTGVCVATGLSQQAGGWQVLAEEVETGIGPVFLLNDLLVRWT